MKKLNFKNLLKLGIVSFLMLILGYFVVYLVIVEIGKHSHTELIGMVEKEVKNGLDYPDNFEKIMLKIRPSEKYIKTKSLFHDRVFATSIGMNKLARHKYNQSYYSEEILEIINDKQLRKQRWTNIFDEKMLFAIGLEHKLSAKEIEAFYFLNKTINLKVGESEYKRLTGLHEVALERFGKKVEKLEAIELVELFVLMDTSGAFYQEDEEKLKGRIKIFKRYIQK